MTSFEHDGQGRLAAAHRADGTTQWRAPGPSGNLFKTPERRDRRYGKGGVLLQDDCAQYAYDLDGNLMKKVEPDGSEWVYEWNGAGMLVAVTKPDGTKVEFQYDALRRRVKKSVGETSTRWVWDANTPIHEVTREGTTTWVFNPGTFAPLGKIAPDGKKYGVVTDYLGTPTEMFDEAGKLAWKAQLDIYGVAKLTEGLAQDCPWRWPGQYEDAETGLYYNRFRYYDAGRGNYVSQDPIGLAAGPALYDYVGDPLAQADALGLEGFIVIGENQMGRVVPFANAVGASSVRYPADRVYRGTLTEEQNLDSIAFNREWIQCEIAEGRTILDVGRDPDRVAAGTPISRWYAAELEEIAAAKARGEDVQVLPTKPKGGCGT